MQPDSELHFADLSRRIAAARGPTGRLRLPADLRAEAAAAAFAARAQGRSAQAIAELLGVSAQSIFRWTETTAMVPVRVRAEPAVAPALISPGGWRVEGLDLASLGALLRVLA